MCLGLSEMLPLQTHSTGQANHLQGQENSMPLLSEKSSEESVIMFNLP